MDNKRFIYAVDLDSTLAYYDAEQDKDKPDTYIGPPIPKMIARVKKWLNEGERVKLFTARAATLNHESKKAIDDWCEKHLGQKLEITNEKDHSIKIIYDNIAREVVDNTGELKSELILMQVAEIVKKHLSEHKNTCGNQNKCNLYQELRMMAELLEE